MNQVIMKKVFIIIPAYNEEENLIKLLKSIPSLPDIELQVIVIDDGSMDNTAYIAKDMGALLLSNRFNMGLALTFRKGLQYCVDNHADIMIILDGDGQYSPNQISSLISPLIKNSTDLCMGNRFLDNSNYQGSVLKKITNYLLSFFISRILLKNRYIFDVQSSFRAFNWDFGEFLLENLRGSYNYSQEMFILAYMNDFKINQVPVKCFKRMNGSSRLIKNPLIHVFKIVKISLFIYFQQKFLKSSQ
jgi:glycosyltransferase involved in cell wall biosynthesis